MRTHSRAFRVRDIMAYVRIRLLMLCGIGLAGCTDPGPNGHGAVAEGIFAPLGDILPSASAEQRATFERGLEVSQRRFAVSEGLGPAFNVTFCGACHERPTPGGAAGLYRNFAITGSRLADGSFIEGESAGMAGGVQRVYASQGQARPQVPQSTTIYAQRNPIAFFGAGLLAELDNEEILSRADPDDEDNDGISGRPNWERGFVGRFGRKAQTASIEGFIRGPLFNHMGITTDPLTDAQRAALPVDSSSRDTSFQQGFGLSQSALRTSQAAVFDDQLTDEDDVADPEMSTADLYDVVSFAMLLAVPELEALDEQGDRGRKVFDEIGCADCHTPRLKSARGALPAYSDLLLHDMGEALADNIDQGEAGGAEFRTQPLWGLAAVGPFLHDGRATTVQDAVLMHGGEAQRSRDYAANLSPEDMQALLTFLGSLGGALQYSEGLMPPDEPVPELAAYGGPREVLSPELEARFEAGRRLFDREFGVGEGLGSPRLNGDSCRACHFDPVFGGAGPLGVNVMRHGIIDEQGAFISPAVGTILHKTTSLFGRAPVAQDEANVFESRQTPHLFGLGYLDEITEAEIVSRADPDDSRDNDGISGRVSYTDDGRVGRFGWKAQVPSLAEFVRDAVTAELGMTLPYQDGLSFGRMQDNDDVADPEFSLGQAELLAWYLAALAAPPRQPGSESTQDGLQIFEEVGCAGCHVPALNGPSGPVPAFTDLLLHEILPEGSVGIEDTSASMREFRTAPLWGLSQTAPYGHSGEAETIEAAIELHDGEARASVEAWRMLSEADRSRLLAFLGSL